MSAHTITFFFISILTFFYSVFVIYNNWKASVNRKFFALNIVVALWAFSHGMLGISKEMSEAIFWMRAIYTWKVFTPALFLQLVLSFLNTSQIQQKRLLVSGYSLSAIFLFINLFFPQYFTSIRYIDIEGFSQYYATTQVIFPYFVIFYLTTVIYSIYIILQKMYLIDKNSDESKQIKWLIIGAVVGFGGGITTFLPLFKDIPPFGIFLVPLYIPILSYAVFQYRFLNIDSLIQKGINYFLLMTLSLLPLFFLVALISSFLSARPAPDINLFLGISLLNSFIGLLFGIIIYLNNRESKLHRQWMIFSLCYSLWSFGLGMMAASNDKEFGLFWGRVLFAGAIFIPATYVHFILLFLNKEKQYAKLLKLCYLISAIFFFSNFTKYFVADVRPILSFAYWTKAGILMYPYTLMFIGLIFLGIVELIKSYLKAKGTYRSQIQYVLLALIIGYGAGLTNFLPTYDIYVYPYGNYIVPFWVALMSYAIIKYRLMNIDIVYKKGAVYSAGLLLILAPAFLIILWAEKFFLGSVNLSLSIVLLCVVAVSAIAFYNLKMRTEQALENTLFYKKYNPYKILTSFTKEMVSVITLDELLNKTINTFVETLKIKKASVFLFDEEKKAYIIKASYGLDEEKNKIKINQDVPLINYFIEKEDVAIREEIERYPSTQQTQEMIKILKDIESEIAIPFMEKDKIVGFCNLSAKGDRSMYNHEDIELFLSLGKQASIAIKNAQLIEQIKESKQVIRRIERLKTVGDLAAGFAHEIRNPLVPIKACLQLLPSRYGKDPDFTEKIPRYALQEVERIERLLREIMDYSRPRTSVFAEEDINEVIEGTVRFIEYQAKKKGVKIERGYDENLPVIKVDREQIKQVLLNLIMNAMDAVNGIGKIEVATRKVRHMLSPCGKIGEGGYVQIEVRDNGTGIANEDLDRIFNPFYTTKHESSDGREGTGLGLSIVQEIVSEHCGFVDVRSEVGAGSSFYVNLPVEIADKKEQTGRRGEDTKIK